MDVSLSLLLLCCGLLQDDWIGQCGVPPAQVQGVPSAICERLPTDNGNNPSSSLVPAAALASGESSLWNMQRVGAYDSTARTVPNAAAALAATGYTAVVVDTVSSGGSGCRWFAIVAATAVLHDNAL